MGLGAGFGLKDKKEELILPTDLEQPDLTSIPYGWTAILEDWLSYGGGLKSESSAAVRNKSDFKRRVSTKAVLSRKGPYEILIKERMMGLYLAVYVHREIKHLVRGMDVILPAPVAGF